MQNRIELYKQTEEVLYTAYFDDTLKHANCCYCAVGNICAASSKITGVEREAWSSLFITTGLPGMKIQSVFTFSEYEPRDVEAMELIEATGYTKNELKKIEWAFESTDPGSSEEDYMFNGLVAVLEVLKDIHGITKEDIDLGRFQKVHAGRVSMV